MRRQTSLRAQNDFCANIIIPRCPSLAKRAQVEGYSINGLLEDVAQLGLRYAGQKSQGEERKAQLELGSETSNARRSGRNQSFAAWAVTLLLSALPNILWQETMHRSTPWLFRG
jgi:hypothetical protein